MGVRIESFKLEAWKRYTVIVIHPDCYTPWKRYTVIALIFQGVFDKGKNNEILRKLVQEFIQHLEIYEDS